MIREPYNNDQCRKIAMDYKIHPVSYLEYKYKMSKRKIHYRIKHYYDITNQPFPVKKKRFKKRKKEENVWPKAPYKTIGYGVKIYQNKYLYKASHLEKYFKMKKTVIVSNMKRFNVHYYRFSRGGSYHISSDTIRSWRRKALNPLKITRVT